MNELTALMELRADLPASQTDDLAGARDQLMAEIHRTALSPGRLRAGPTRSGPPWGARLRGRPGWARGRSRAALAVGTALVAAAAITAGLLAGPGGGAALPPGAISGGGTTLTAAYVLGRAATAASAARPPRPGPDQYVYVSSVDTELSLAGGTIRGAWLSTSRRDIWLSASGRRAGVLRIVPRGTTRLPWGTAPISTPGGPVEWDPLPGSSCAGGAPRDSYAFLATLPTAPGPLRAWIYQHENGGQQADQQAWTDIGDMLRENLVPPKLAAALFRVAATIPGAAVIPHATDAAGRPGIAVARYQSGFQADSELVFDRNSYQLLGERSVLARPVKGEGPAGTVIETTAQLHVSVVSHLPRYRASGQGTVTSGGSC